MLERSYLTIWNAVRSWQSAGIGNLGQCCGSCWRARCARNACFGCQLHLRSSSAREIPSKLTRLPFCQRTKSEQETPLVPLQSSLGDCGTHRLQACECSVCAAWFNLGWTLAPIGLAARHSGSGGHHVAIQNATNSPRYHSVHVKWPSNSKVAADSRLAV